MKEWTTEVTKEQVEKKWRDKVDVTRSLSDFCDSIYNPELNELYAKTGNVGADGQWYKLDADSVSGKALFVKIFKPFVRSLLSNSYTSEILCLIECKKQKYTVNATKGEK